MMWKSLKLEDLVTLQNGYAFKSSEYSEDGYFVMRITNVQHGYIAKNNPKFIQLDNTPKLAKFILSAGDILLSLTGDVGRVGIINEEHLPAVLNQRVARVVNKDTKLLDTRYLFHFLNSKIFRHQVESFAHGAAQANVSTKDISQIGMQVPPLAEQKRIVAKLDAAFAEIDEAIQATEAKEAEIRELQAAFLSTSLNEETVTWKTVKLGDVCELAYGKALDKSDRLEGDGIPAFGANGVKAYSKKSLFNEPSIIVGRKGSAGAINKVAAPFWALDVTYYTKIKKEIITLDFLFYTLTTLNLPSMARGVKPGINRNDVYNKNIPLPPIDEQKNIVTKLDATFADIEAAHIVIKKKKENCEALKSALLAQELQSEAV